MRFTTCLLLALQLLLQVAGAQSAIPSTPACAARCMELAIPQSSCSAKDQHCICADVRLQSNVTACVKTNCSVKEGLTTLNIAAQTCDWPDHNKQPLLRKVTIPFLVFATLFYVSRMLARLPVWGGELGPDDYMISIAYLLGVGFNIVLLLLASAGLGKDIWEVPFSNSNDQVTYTLQLFTALEKLYILTVWITKISILLLYLRIFPDSKFRIHTRLCLAFCAVTLFCLFSACLFKCWPINYSWTYWDGEHHGSCSSQNAQGWANAALNIFGDLLVLGLPLPTIWKMSLSKGKRFGIMFMFGVGIFITVISLVRLYTLKLFSLGGNPTWDFVNLCLWSLLEINVGIMCACLPGIRNFYNRIVCGRLLGKGPFASGAARAGSHGFFKPHMSRGSQQTTDRSNSALSNSSSNTTMANAPLATHGKEFILIVNDVDIEEKSMSSISDVRDWTQYECMIEEWPTPRYQAR